MSIPRKNVIAKFTFASADRTAHKCCDLSPEKLHLSPKILNKVAKSTLESIERLSKVATCR